MKPRILLVNGSLGGRDGNTAAVLTHLAKQLESEASVAWLHLAEKPSQEETSRALNEAQGFVFASGVYWDSWSSHMQAFFETTTALEAGPVWMGKPAAAIVTMHSVGGKEVLSRLQGALSTLGLMIPPMSGMIYSLVNHLALQTPPTRFHSDIWSLSDLEIIAKNLLTAIHLSANDQPEWTPWPVDTSDPQRIWIR